MKTMDIAILAGVGIVGYGLINSDFFKGLGGVGSGVGEAVEGAGAGVAQLSSAIGNVGQDVAELTSFVGEFGNWTAQQFTELQQSSLREWKQEDTIDQTAFDQSQTELARIQAEKEIELARIAAGTDVSGATGDSLRSSRWDTFKTDGQDKILDFFIEDGNSSSNSNIPTPSKLTPFNPLTSIGNFIKSVASPNITGNVVGSKSSNSSDKQNSSTSKTSTLKNSPVVTSSRNKFLEKLGYEGTSTLDGVSYSQPTFNFRSLLK